MAKQLIPLDEQTITLLDQARTVLNDPLYSNSDRGYLEGIVARAHRYKGLSPRSRDWLPSEINHYNRIRNQNEDYTEGFRQPVIDTIEELTQIADNNRDRRKELFEIPYLDNNFLSYLRGTKKELTALRSGGYLTDSTLKPALRLSYLLLLVGLPTEQITMKLQKAYRTTGDTRDFNFSPNNPIRHVIIRLNGLAKQEKDTTLADKAKAILSRMEQREQDGLPREY